MDEQGSVVRRGHVAARRTAIIVFGVFVALLGAWVQSDPVSNLSTDWTAFDNAATRLFAGDEVYVPVSDDEPLPYLYPPFVLLLATPLAPLGFFASWIFSAMLMIVPFVAGVRLLVREFPDTAARATGSTVAICSGTVLSAALIGQYSGIYVFSFGLGVHLWRRDRKLLAGLALAILIIKPNIAIVVPVAFLWSRSWRALLGFGIGGFGLLVLSLPFGIQRWAEFVSNVRAMADAQAEGFVISHKMVTIVGSAESVLVLGSSSAVLIAIWVVSTLILGIATLSVWTPSQLEHDPIRSFAVLAIFAVIANPRMYFYDAALLVFGALALWMGQERAGGVMARRWTGPMCLALWVFSWGGVFPPLNLYVGPLAAVLVLGTVFDARAKGGKVDGDVVLFPVEETAVSTRAA